MKVCKCEVVLSKDIGSARCVGATPIHKLCNGKLAKPFENRLILDDRPEIEYR